MHKTRFTVLTGMILVVAASRLIPHPPNFTPIMAAFDERRLRVRTKTVAADVRRRILK